MDGWSERLTGEKFHGGEVPDRCDFRMVSEMDRIAHMPWMKGIIRSRPRDC